MKSITVLFFLICCVGLAFAEDKNFSASAWLDVAGGNQGMVVYPQCAWSASTSAGKLAGFSFIEAIPHAQVYSNHSVRFYPGKQGMFGIRGEFGTTPFHFKDFHYAQAGVVVESSGIVKNAPVRVSLAFLPRISDARATQFLVSGDTNKFQIAGKKIRGSVEFFRYNGTDGGHYGETYLLFHYAEREHVIPYVNWISNGNKNQIVAGLRFQ